jgi:hypothetical protein
VFNKAPPKVKPATATTTTAAGTVNADGTVNTDATLADPTKDGTTAPVNEDEEGEFDETTTGAGTATPVNED